MKKYEFRITIEVDGSIQYQKVQDDLMLLLWNECKYYNAKGYKFTRTQIKKYKTPLVDNSYEKTK